MARDKRQELSDTAFEAELLRQLRKERRDDREPGRWEYVLSALRERGLQPVEDTEGKCIRFDYMGNTVTVYPYKGWFTGKGVKDGRGIAKLLKQIDR